MSSPPRTRSFVIAAGVAAAACSSFAVPADRAVAATITAAYEQGRPDVVINGYGTDAMGTFRLRDGSDTHLALCIEADVTHSGATDAYGPVGSSVESARLDALLWWLDRQPSIDDDTAVAASALAWFYADARRSIGPPVWSDGTRAFTPITPETPEPWDALAPFSMSHPIGLAVPGAHLDAAERRVAELHRIATRLSGAWQLDVVADGGTAHTRLSVGGAPLAGQPIDMVVEPVGGTAITRTVVTNDDGRASMSVPTSSEGYTVRATTAAPGPHREWDGAGAVQRLATPTTRTVAGSASRGPDEGHLVVRKRSTDPTIGVEGAEFDLIDADGAVVATARTDIDGLARFTDIDRAAHPAPYSIVETSAPAGLVASPEPVVVERLGVDPADPPVVEITNEPATGVVLIHKVLDVDAVGPRDRSGFEFTLRRRTDGTEHRVVTDPAGTSAPLDLPLGTYDVCEAAVPVWATGLIDTGCRTVEVTLDGVGSTVEVIYVNEVPEPSIDTRAADPSDGDQVVGTHQTTVVDRVQLDGLVPGTTYRVRGELVEASSGAPSGFVGWAEFSAHDRSADVEIVIELTDPAVGDWVVVDEVYVGDVVLARHADLEDADQTVTVVAPPSTTSSTPTTTTTTTTIPTTVPAVSTTSTTSTTSVSTAPATTPAPPRPPSTLPPTGGDAVATALRIGDVGFVLGVGLIAIAGLVPSRRRSGRDEAGR